MDAAYIPSEFSISQFRDKLFKGPVFALWPSKELSCKMSDAVRGGGGEVNLQKSIRQDLINKVGWGGKPEFLYERTV